MRPDCKGSLLSLADRADCHCMSVMSGDSIEIFASSGASARHEGAVVAASQAAIAVCFEFPVVWTPAEDVYLLTQTASGRLVTIGQFERDTGEIAIFRVLAPWRTYNRRLHRRYAAHARVALLSPENAGLDGHIVDISLSGARVAVDSVPESPIAAVRIAISAEWFEFPCTVRGTIIEGDEIFVRLRFTGLTPDQVESLQHFLGLLEGLERQDPWFFTA